MSDWSRIVLPSSERVTLEQTRPALAPKTLFVLQYAVPVVSAWVVVITRPVTFICTHLKISTQSSGASCIDTTGQRAPLT